MIRTLGHIFNLYDFVYIREQEFPGLGDYEYLRRPIRFHLDPTTVVLFYSLCIFNPFISVTYDFFYSHITDVYTGYICVLSDICT